MTRSRRRGDRDDPELDRTAWLAELDQGDDDADEEDWARTLRRRRARDPGEQAPPEPPPRAPDSSLLNMESDRGAQLPDWEVDWGTQDPLARPTREPEPDWSGRSIEAEAPLAWRVDPQAGMRSWADPPAQDPAAIYGELQARAAAAADPDWSSWPAAEPHRPAQPDAWPPEEPPQSWEPSDRSWIWPAEELAPATGTWEPEPPAWPEEPAWRPPAPPEPYEQVGTPPWTAPAPGDALATRAWTPEPAPPRTAEPEAASYPFRTEQEPPVPLGAAGQEPAGGDWTPRGVAGAYTPGGAPAVPAPERYGGGATRMDPGGLHEQVDGGRGGRRARQTEGRRRSWPRVVAILSWIVLLMVVCWFYVFPWLERVLPSNF
jgi:hypothetical protein